MSIAITDTAAVVAAHEAFLRGVVRRRMADPALVDDAVQETLLRVCRSSPPEDPTQMRPWLTTLAKRTCADVWRAHQRVATSLDGRGADRLPACNAVVPGSDEHLGAVATRSGIKRALGQLSPRHRRLLEKQAVLGLTYEEIADEEDVSVACVTSALGRARAGFRRGYTAPAWAVGLQRLADRVRARLQAMLNGHAVELAAASMTIGVAAAVLVGAPAPAMPNVVRPVLTAGTTTAPVAARAQAPAPPRLDLSPAAAPATTAQARAGAPHEAPVDHGAVGDVAVDPPRVELTPEEWTLRYGVEAKGPGGAAHVRATVELHCEGGKVMAAVCPLAPQP